MPSEAPREPINWREDLRELFYAEAAIIMNEVFTEIRESLRSGTTNTSLLVDPHIRELRDEIFGDLSRKLTDDEGDEGYPF